jgi:hypothetical protein
MQPQAEMAQIDLCPWRRMIRLPRGMGGAASGRLEGFIVRSCPHPVLRKTPGGYGSRRSDHHRQRDMQEGRLCVRICPKVFTQRESGGVPEFSRPEFCNDCGHCCLSVPPGRYGTAILRKGHHRSGEGPHAVVPAGDGDGEARRSIRNFPR